MQFLQKKKKKMNRFTAYVCNLCLKLKTLRKTLILANFRSSYRNGSKSNFNHEISCHIFYVKFNINFRIRKNSSYKRKNRNPSFNLTRRTNTTSIHVLSNHPLWNQNRSRTTLVSHLPPFPESIRYKSSLFAAVYIRQWRRFATRLMEMKSPGTISISRIFSREVASFDQLMHHRDGFALESR